MRDPSEAALKREEQATYDNRDRSSRPAYDSLWDDDYMDWLLQVGAGREWSEFLRRYARDGPLLDIGCGPGSNVSHERRINPDRAVVGIDISREQLLHADEHATGRLLQGDGERLPFHDGAFKTVLTHSALHHLPEWRDRVLPEIRRVLDDEGTFVFYEPGAFNPPALFRRRFLKSSSHTPNEAPFDPSELATALHEQFETVELSGHYVVSNALPVLDELLPVPVPRPLVSAVYRIERKLPFAQRLSWILVGRASP